MPIRIPPDGHISRDELECIMRANAIELREKQREQARAIETYRLGISDIDKK
jgi:hypothetical protein